MEMHKQQPMEMSLISNVMELLITIFKLYRIIGIWRGFCNSHQYYRYSPGDLKTLYLNE